MTLSPDQAADALRDVADIERRSSRAYCYLQASPHLILWGGLWAVGYGLTDAWPHRAVAVWGAIDAIGLASSFLIEVRNAAGAGRRAGVSADPTRRQTASDRWTFPVVLLTAVAFTAATLAVMWPVSGRQVGAFIPLVVAAGYALAGIWTGARFVVAAAAIAGLTLAGFFLLPAHFNLWMAVVGGGALVLAGIWVRRV